MFAALGVSCRHKWAVEQATDSESEEGVGELMQEQVQIERS